MKDLETLPLHGKIWSLTTDEGSILTDKVTLVFSPTKIEDSILLEYETLTLKNDSSLKSVMSVIKGYEPKCQLSVEDIFTAFDQHKQAVYEETCPHCDGEGECLCDNVCHHCGGSGYTDNVSEYYSTKRVVLPEFGLSLGRLNDVARMAQELEETHIKFQMVVKGKWFFFVTEMQGYTVVVAGLKDNPKDIVIEIAYKKL